MRQTICAAVLALGAILAQGCTKPDEAKAVLQAEGYTQVQLTGWEPFACSKDDSFSTGFTAVGPTGIKVKGTVCSGWLKGSTVRLLPER